MASALRRQNVGNVAVGQPVSPLVRDWSSEACTPVQEKFNICHTISRYPQAFQTAVEKISTHIPDLLRAVREAVGEPIRLELQVELPQFGRYQKYVCLSELEERHLSVDSRWVHEQKGRKVVLVKDLIAQGIRPEVKIQCPAEWHRVEKSICIKYDVINKGIVSSRVFRIMAQLIFELNNARFNREFDAIFSVEVKKPPSKQDFPLGIENIEFITLQETRRQLEDLVQKRLFPFGFNCYRMTYPDFDLHLRFQEISGHTEPYAESHDNLFGTERHASYRGRWLTPLYELKKEEKASLHLILQDHLCALYGPEAETEMYIHEMRQRVRGLKEGQTRTGLPQERRLMCQRVYANIVHFNECYTSYVKAHQPDKVVYLIEPDKVVYLNKSENRR